MARKISAVLLLTLFVFSLFAVSAFAAKEKAEPLERKVNFKHRFPVYMTIEEATEYEQRIDDRAEFSADAEEDLSFIPSTSAGGMVPGEIKDYPIPPGAIYSGETTYDYQHNGGPHRTIQHAKDPTDPGGPKTYVHVTWMGLKSYVLTDPNRNIYYNCYDWTVPGWTVSTDDWGGMPIIEVGERGGYTHVDVNSSGNAIVFHHSAVDGATAYGRVARFSIPGMGIYTADALPNPTGQQSIWARGAIGQTETGPLATADVYHVGAQDSNPGPGDASYQSYWRYIAPTGPWEGPVPMSQAMSLSHELAANGERVIYAYAAAREYGIGRNQLNNDLVYFESLSSGADWIAGGGFDIPDVDAGAAYNVTSYVDSDPHRVYLDLSMMFDYDGRLHALFNAPGYDDDAGTVSVGPTIMLHWDEGTPGSNENAQVSGGTPIGFVDGTDEFHSVAAAAMWGANDPDLANDGASGVWNRYISKMTLGIGDGSTACSDPENNDNNLGYLYAGYTLFGGEDPDDKEDASASGFQNGNYAISMSNDNGYSWAAPKILTTADGSFDGTGIPTRTPDCDCPTDLPEDPECANPCMSEHWGSIAKVVNDTLHAFYIVDVDAGGVPQAEGNWAVNKTVYHPAIGGGTIDGVLCPKIAPVLNAELTGSLACEYHGDLATGPGLSPYDNETLSIDNYGNADLDYDADIDYASGSDWMTIDGGSYIPSTTIPKGGATEEYPVIMDAGETDGKGLYQATIQVHHNDDARPDPYPITVSFFVADSFVCGTGTIITTPTVALEVSNVSSWGRTNGIGMWYYNASDNDTLYTPIFDGSLVIVDKTATAAGPDTISYRNIFGNATPANPGFRALEEMKLSYIAETDESVAVANQVTTDSTIGITVQYLFPQAADSAEFVRLKFKIYPNTFSDPDLIVGACMDLDVGTTTQTTVGTQVTNGDVGGVVADYNLVYCQGTELDTVSDGPDDDIDVTDQYAAGITALSCVAAKRLVVQSNRDYVYPSGGFTDQYIYEEFDSAEAVTIWYDMEDDDGGLDVVDDIHVLLAFPEVTLTEDAADENGSHVFQMALVTSTQAEEDVDAFDYHTAGSYDSYVLDLIDQTKKAWKKAFGWCGSFAINYGAGDYTVGPDGALYLNATGTHEGGINGGCCGCQFSLVSVVPDPTEGTITLEDDGDCHAHIQCTGLPDGPVTHTITVSVSDMCGDQTEEMTFDLTVKQLCYCGQEPGDVDDGGGAPTPLDVSLLVTKVYKQQDFLFDFMATGCPYENGDVDGNGGAPTPLDVSLLVTKVYKQQDFLCQDRCVGCP